MKVKECAYCGKTDSKLTREHVIPKNLYPKSKAESKVQRLTIPSCEECNNGWSDDEAHFRNVLVFAGDSNESVREIWNSTMRRSFDEVDGSRRVNDLFHQLVPTKVDGKGRHMIYPGNDDRVLRIVRKIVRGLSYHHDLTSPVCENQVFADVQKYIVPPELEEIMEYHHRDSDIFEYKFAVLNQVGIDSAWLLTFFQRRTFLAAVFNS